MALQSLHLPVWTAEIDTSQAAFLLAPASGSTSAAFGHGDPQASGGAWRLKLTKDTKVPQDATSPCKVWILMDFYGPNMFPMHPVLPIYCSILSILLIITPSLKELWERHTLTWFAGATSKCCVFLTSFACCTDFAAFGIRHWDWCPGRCHSDPFG